MSLSPERARTLAIYDKYGPLLCESCEVGTPGGHALTDIWPELCVECAGDRVAPYPAWYHRYEDGSWEPWDVRDVGYLPDFPWEVWIEENRYAVADTKAATS